MSPDSSYQNHLHKSRSKSLALAFFIGAVLHLLMGFTSVLNSNILGVTEECWIHILLIYLGYGAFLSVQRYLVIKRGKQEWRALLNGICVAVAIPDTVWMIQLNTDLKPEILREGEAALRLAFALLPVAFYQVFILSKISLFQWKISSWVDALGMVGIPI